MIVWLMQLATYNIYNKSEPILQFDDSQKADCELINNALIDEHTKMLFMKTKDLKDIIKSRNNKKSSGCDSLPNFALKKMSFKFIYFMTIFMNHITNTQHIPKAWKNGVVTALPKPGKDSSNVKNWRPITMLPSVSKCYEKHIDNVIRNFCTSTKIFDPNQFGFRSSRATTHAAAKFTSDVIKGLNNKTPTFAILIDLQAAFDVIWHHGLIHKMHLMKIPKPIVRIICNYLKNRSFEVKYEDKISTKKIVTAGCPQGSILAATLFLLYMNDFPKIVNPLMNIKRILYADDIIVYCSSRNIDYAKNVMNQFLNKIYNFFSDWKLKINITKCESIAIIGNYKDLEKKIRKKAKEAKFKINNDYINKKIEVKYLGIIFNSNFQFKGHIDHIMKKVNMAQNQLRTIFKSKFVNKPIKLLAYKQLIRPLMTYACPIWSNINALSSAQMERIRKKERWFLRYCLNIFRNPITKKYVNSKELYNRANINRIDREIVAKNIDFVEKCKTSSIHEIADIFENTNRNISTKKYKPIETFYQMKNQNKLYENGKLLVFNRSKTQTNKIVYVTEQNTN